MRFLMTIRPGKRKYQSKITIRPTKVVNSFAARELDDQVAALHKRLTKIMGKQRAIQNP